MAGELPLGSAGPVCLVFMPPFLSRGAAARPRRRSISSTRCLKLMPSSFTRPCRCGSRYSERSARIRFCRGVIEQGGVEHSRGRKRVRHDEPVHDASRSTRCGPGPSASPGKNRTSSTQRITP